MIKLNEWTQFGFSDSLDSTELKKDRYIVHIVDNIKNVFPYPISTFFGRCVCGQCMD